MLAQFTWGQFLCCHGAVGLLWCLGLLFTTYRKRTLRMRADAGFREMATDTNKLAAAWFGSCIFLVVVATVLKSFFGI